MKYLLGTDEAGYGPRLGPLVVTATLWRIDADEADVSLYERLQNVVTARPDGTNDRRLWLADSKEVKQARDGMRRLELGALATLGVGGVAADELRTLLAGAEARTDRTFDLQAEPWHAVDVPLPIFCAAEQPAEQAARLSAGLREAGVALVAVRTRCLFPREYNAGVDRFDNKADLLAETTLGLVRQLLDLAEAGDVEVTCDKFGGRNGYAPLLQQHLTEGLVQTIGESRAASAYRFADGPRRVRIGFYTGGESHLPAAAASMVSKYLREAALTGWNAYWSSIVPNLRPTAGYEVDAQRFRREIAAAAAAQQLDERDWWRLR